MAPRDPFRDEMLRQGYAQLRGVGPDPQWCAEDALPVANFVSAALERLRLDERFRACEIQNHWSELVGVFNAAHSHPESMRRGVLYVKVSSSPQRHQFEMLRRDWLKRLQDRLGPDAVKDIRFIA